MSRFVTSGQTWQARSAVQLTSIGQLRSLSCKLPLFFFSYYVGVEGVVCAGYMTSTTSGAIAGNLDITTKDSKSTSTSGADQEPRKLDKVVR